MNWSTTDFEPKDLASLSKFIKTQKGDDGYGSMDMFQWKVIDNVVKPAMFTLVKNDDDVISSVGIVPKNLYLNGEAIEAGELVDGYTDKNFLRQGLFLLVLNKCTEKALSSGTKVIYGTPNDTAMKVYEAKTQYRKIEEIKVKNLAFRIHINKAVEKRSNWYLGLYANTLYQTVTNPYFALRQWVKGNKTLKISEVTELPEGWDDFWESARQPYDFILSKDAKSFAWRYLKSPDKYHVLIAHDASRVCGYVVYRIIGSGENRTLVIADCLASEKSRPALHGLLYEARRAAVKAGVSSMGVWMSLRDFLYQEFLKFGFLQCEDIKVICYTTEFTNKNVKPCQSWHFTIGDSDNI